MSKNPGNPMKTQEAKPSQLNAANSGAIDLSMISDFVSRSDEAAKRRLDSINQKLRDMERQMEVLEAQISMANFSYQSHMS